MSQAYAVGCRKIQFIGGEPQLSPDFHELLVKAKSIGFEFIEVFSNLTRLDDETIAYAGSNGICFATSVYSDEPASHDAITKVKASHARTIANLKKLIEAGIDTRAAVIVVDQDKLAVDRTMGFLRDLGVKRVRHGETREFGRGEGILARNARLSGLCGHCWAGKLCIAPDGDAYPCVMARHWPVGNVLETPLSEIIGGRPLEDMRQTIFDTVWLPKVSDSNSFSSSLGCPPGDPQCGPDTGAPDCAPELAEPENRPEPDEPACPQSCEPDLSCPGGCPQCCDPADFEEHPRKRDDPAYGN